MTQTLNVFQVDAFTTEKFSGNPAGVVLNADGLSNFQMQSIARELNNSETAFVLSPEQDSHEVWLRYFTPFVEVPICGHATIAAHYVRAVQNNLESCTLMHKTGAGILPIQITRSNKDYSITMTQGKIELEPPLGEKICRKIRAALKITKKDLDPRCPVQIVSTGHSKIIIGLRSSRTMNHMAPDFNRLVQISRAIGCNGYFIFTFDSDDPEILTRARMFAPAIGINEDPVTGNGNGPLGAYLVHNNLVDHDNQCFSFKGMQGEAIHRPGIVVVQVDIKNNKPVETRVMGQAVIVFNTQIKI